MVEATDPNKSARTHKARTEKVLQTFEGRGRSTTRPFSVPDRFELRWSSKGTFQAGLREEGKADDLGMFEDLFANQQKGEGSAYRLNGGRYYIDVNAIGKWKIEVVQLP